MTEQKNRSRSELGKPFLKKSKKFEKKKQNIKVKTQQVNKKTTNEKIKYGLYK